MSEDNVAYLRGKDAQAVLNNPAWKMAVERVDKALEAKALACDPDNRESTQRVIITKQLFQALKRELQRVMEDGDVAEFQMRELDPKKRLFRR